MSHCLLNSFWTGHQSVPKSSYLVVLLHFRWYSFIIEISSPYLTSRKTTCAAFVPTNGKTAVISLLQRANVSGTLYARMSVRKQRCLTAIVSHVSKVIRNHLVNQAGFPIEWTPYEIDRRKSKGKQSSGRESKQWQMNNFWHAWTSSWKYNSLSTPTRMISWSGSYFGTLKWYLWSFPVHC